MSFWSDASPIVKGAIVIGVLGLLYFGAAFVAKWPPFYEVEQTQQRGLTGPEQGSQE